MIERTVRRTASPAAGEAKGKSPALPRMRRILVGLDERGASRDAVAMAGALHDLTGAELVLATVRPYRPALLGPGRYARVIAEDEARLGREARRTLGERRFTTHVLAGRPETGGLKEIAAAENADLIVVGSSHRDEGARTIPGSVGERVLDDAPCAVAVAPLGLAESGFELGEVAIAYDGSRQAGVALSLAIELAERAGARLQILGVVESREEREAKRMRSHLGRAKQQVPVAIAVETRLLHGTPAGAIVEAAELSDLLVLGSRGHFGPARRLFLGSVAAQVLRQAPCPTLVAANA